MLIGMARNDPNCHGLMRPFPVQKHGLIRIHKQKRNGTRSFFFVKPSLRISRWFILGDETNSVSIVPGDPTCRPSVEEWRFQRKKSLGNQVVSENHRILSTGQSSLSSLPPFTGWKKHHFRIHLLAKEWYPKSAQNQIARSHWETAFGPRKLPSLPQYPLVTFNIMETTMFNR